MKAIGKHVLFAAVLAMGGCGTRQDTAVQTATTADDPAAANLAPVSEAQPVVTQPEVTQPSVTPPPVPRPVVTQPPPYSESPYSESESIAYAPEPPPPLPEYTQPQCPGENYIWTPGTWNYATTGYYWVPGVWVMAPFIGALWTPSYWDYEGARYRWHRGYWAPHIGFYGGINYGYGYIGRGYEGGYWSRNVFTYNRAVTNVNVTIVHNVYEHPVSARGFGNRVSYNGGHGGINARPIAAEVAVMRERPVAPVAAQVEHFRQSAGNREQFASVNHGRPQMVVAARPLATSYREPARERPVQQETRPMPPARMEQGRPMQAEQPRPQQPRSEPARPAAHMPQNETRPVAPVRAEPRVDPRQDARPPQPVPRQRQEARPEQPVQQRPMPQRQEPRQEARPQQPVQRQEIRPPQPQPRPESRPQQQQAPRHDSHPEPAARPTERPAPQRPENHPGGRPEEKKK